MRGADQAATTERLSAGRRPGALVLGLLIGFGGVVFLSFFIHWYEIRIVGSRYIPPLAVNALVPAALCLIFLLIVLLNPLLGSLLPGLRLGRRELLLIFSLWAVTLAVCFRTRTVRFLNAAGNTFGRTIRMDKTIQKARVHDYLRRDLFLPDEPGRQAASDYYFGLSPDGHTWVRPFPRPALLRGSDVADAVALARRLVKGEDPLSRYLATRLVATAPRDLEALIAEAEALEPLLLAELNAVMRGPLIYTRRRFARVHVPEEVQQALEDLARTGREPDEAERMAVNRSLIAQAYPGEFARSAGSHGPFGAADIVSPPRLLLRIVRSSDRVSRYLRGRFSGSRRRFEAFSRVAARNEKTLAGDLNRVLQEVALYEEGHLRGVVLSTETRRRLAGTLDEKARLALNRRLLEEAYPGIVRSLPPAVPWRLWLRPLAFWGGLMLVLVIFSASLVRMMHRQWSQHELLAYPLAGVADSLVGVRRGRRFPEVFYDRLFWFGFVLVFLLFVINGLHQWFNQMIQVPIGFSHRSILMNFRFLSKYCGREAYALFRGWLYPFVACLAVLVPVEISLTCWLGWTLMIFGTGFYFMITGEVITHHETTHIHAGMYVALAMAILWIGRREYVNIVRCALFLGRNPDAGIRRAATACRVFLLAFAALVGLFMYAGLEWFLAVLLTGSFALVVLLMARLTAEVGHPWLVNFRGVASGLPLKLLGAAALGPQGLAVIAVVGAALDFDTTNSIAAQETTIGKLREGMRSWTARRGFNLVLVPGVLLCAVSAVFFTLWENYSFGSHRETTTHGAIRNDLADAGRRIKEVDVQVGLDKIQSAQGLARLRYAKSDRTFWRFFLFGALVVGLCAFMRLRFAWWPFHPLPLLFINTWAMSRFAFPIMVGWLLKVAILRIWGGKVFARSRPFFYGVIVGQVVVTGLWAIVAVVYYLVEDRTPEVISTFY